MKKRLRSNRKTIEEFKRELYDVWGNKYKVAPNAVYINTHSKIELICYKHGNFFVEANSVLHGHGCKECRRETIGKNRVLNKEDVNKRIKETWGDKYDTSKVDYKNARTKITVTCPKHGDFNIRFHDFVSGVGCPKCNESKLEREVRELLDKNNIEHNDYFKFEWLKNGNSSLSLDFYLPSINLAIECQGRQHFESVISFGGESGLMAVIERDQRKRRLCKENGVELVYFTRDGLMKYLKGENERSFCDINELMEYIKHKQCVQ